MNVRGKRLLAVLCSLVLAGVATAVYLAWSNRESATVPQSDTLQNPVFPPPPFTKSNFLNTAASVQYIGSAACANCHENNHKSYMLTAHSKALSLVDAAREPADSTFEHALSGRTYRVYRKDGQLHHEESVRTEQGKEIGRIDMPVKYLVGSGHFARTYLAEVDGILLESPITYYVSKNKWAMSPGYDVPNHPSFERPVQATCLRCHTGRAEPSGPHAERVVIHERPIGCESCHGPGSLHQKERLATKLPPTAADPTIVHPGRLSRPLQEAICSSCHLMSVASVPVRGRQPHDFRPGLPLSDFQLDYRFEGVTGGMTVVGHIEQLRQSACYQKSPELTCTTCHDPHEREKPRDTVAFFRQKCIDCHETKPCKLPLAERRKANPADNCAACHMPQGTTDIPHVAFTHHRIGKHTQTPQQPSSEFVPLSLIDDNPHLDALDRQRHLALAYYQAVDRGAANPAQVGKYREKVWQAIHEVYQGGHRDADVLFALTEMYRSQGDFPESSRYARELLKLKDVPSDRRARALMFLSLSNWGAPDKSDIGMIEEAMRLRRLSEDWLALGANYLERNQPEKALRALEQAVELQPFHHKIQLGLGQAYHQVGDRIRGNEHIEKARWLETRRPR